MKIVCIGRNYADHIRELNNAVPTAPVFFLKPETALTRRNGPFRYPPFSGEIHYETELVLRIGRGGRNIAAEKASDHIDGIGIGLDMTARDLQDAAKSKGLPWAAAKGFDGSAPVSRFLSPALFPDHANIGFRLDLNGLTVQQGNSSLMLNDFSRIISYVSDFMTLRKGDYIFTGTPAGVGPVHRGDLLEAWLENTRMLTCRVI